MSEKTFPHNALFSEHPLSTNLIGENLPLSHCWKVGNISYCYI